MSKVFAPGKLVLTGAYAVIEGAPAIVVATSRGVTADASRRAERVTPEVRAALGDRAAPYVDVSPLFHDGRKLGLGASAAILVASIAAVEPALGREELFARARAAHAEAQRGGSGVDVAASVHGGVLEYVVGQAPVRRALPAGARLVTFASPVSAVTTELRAKVDAVPPRVRAKYMDELGDIACLARDGVVAGDLGGLVAAMTRASDALGRLGDAAGAPILPRGFAALSAIAAREGAAFCVAGAGGGDVAVFLGSAAPSPAFAAEARALGLFALDLDVDEIGVRLLGLEAAA